jgi:hypothetical protein
MIRSSSVHDDKRNSIYNSTLGNSAGIAIFIFEAADVSENENDAMRHAMEKIQKKV